MQDHTCNHNHKHHLNAMDWLSHCPDELGRRASLHYIQNLNNLEEAVFAKWIAFLSISTDQQHEKSLPGLHCCPSRTYMLPRAENLWP
ncbi:hypothetical protein RRG08_027729 [Elysia crispata]|uniref:Uncharacterized protein n=1 Tax=Elysia crispata TaxID=231223 RepID=A0AAE0YAV7_9GAST|nr:hypothetical protein RRG08_027729 [Elysia crispata]